MPVTLGQNGPNYAKSLPESQLQVRTGHPPEDFSDMSDAGGPAAHLSTPLLPPTSASRRRG